MKAHLEKVTTTYFNCPNCGVQSKEPIDHIVAFLDNPSWQQAISRGNYPNFGPWGCHECGVNVSGIVRSKDDVELTIKPGTDVKVWDVLVLQPQTKPVYFIVDAKDYSRKPGELCSDNKSYFYDEHTCPTNWIRNVERIVIEADTDPHGLFEFVESVDQDTVKEKLHDGQNPEESTYELWEKVFPHLIKKVD